ncbi:serine hydrolase [Ureibacillus thermosphaericus]|uniref:serine hydrolase n=1 Tax=Ureibacillus thermosphaericus TaxID=51173 RepID=UPI0030CA10B9
MEQIRTLLDEANCKVHLVVKDLKTDQYLIAEKMDEVFPSASIIKVPILLAVLHYVQENQFSLTDVVEISPENKVDFSVITEQDLTSCTIYELLLWMIITSDNSATNELIDLLGFEKLNHYFKKIGLAHTNLERKMMDFEKINLGYDNVTTARDMAHLFSLIYQQQLLIDEFNKIAIDILCKQRDYERLKRYIADVRIAHKTGSLDTVCHDAGIVYHPTMDYLIGVFLTELNDFEFGKRFIGRISKIVYDYFE